jgi:hypothetical protein
MDHIYIEKEDYEILQKIMENENNWLKEIVSKYKHQIDDKV